MKRPLRNSNFKGMALIFKFRDLIIPRRRILKEVGIKSGFSVLDFGCGPGGYIAETSKLVGDSGRVYALDFHPLAIRSVEKIVEKNGLKNVKTITPDSGAGLDDSSVDVVLLYDVLHELENPAEIFQEFHRILKAGGVLSASDHHFKKEEIVPRITEGGLFKPAGRGKKTFAFCKS